MGWSNLAWWRKAIYVVLAVPIAFVFAGLLGVIVGSIAALVAGLDEEGFLTVTGIVTPLAVIPLIFVVVRFGMRPDIDYVDSDEYAERNPSVAAGGIRHFP